MNRRLFVQIAAPTIVIGAVLFAVCLLGIWFTLQSQRDATRLMSQEVATLQASEELEIRVRQLRYCHFLQLVDPDYDRREVIAEARRQFEQALEKVRHVAVSPRERQAVEAMDAGYRKYKDELALMPAEAAAAGQQPDLHRLLDAHPIRYVVESCQDLARINHEEIIETVRESDQTGYWTRQALLGLGLLGPLSGVLAGYGIARALSRSIHQLNVRVQDMTNQLDRIVVPVTPPANSDLDHLDQQMQYVVRRVEEAAEKLQRDHRALLRSEQLAAVGQLAASVAHEVRNPLTSIKILVEAAHRLQNRKPLTSEDLEVIRREIARLEQTVQSFLSFARPMAPQRSGCDFRDVLTQAVELVRARAVQLGVGIGVYTPRDQVLVDIDRGQLATVLVNLFLNALDAMPHGGRLEVALQGAPGGSMMLTVADTGSGIAPHMADRLFTPFVSGKPTGTGLGLSISKRIIEEHGGHIAGANRAGGGACFTVALPVRNGESKSANSRLHNV